MRRRLKGLVLGVLIGLSGALLWLSTLGATFETGVGLRWLFNVRGTIAPPPEVVVVAIDGRTGSQLGLAASPREWPRSIHAQLVEALVQHGASVIVFDLLFEKAKSPHDDLAFATAVAKADRVVLVEKLTGKGQPIADSHGYHKAIVWTEELIQPLPFLTESAKGLGAFPLPKLGAAVHEFWVFKESLNDAPVMPAVALQINALRAYSTWLGLLERLNTPGLETLPRSTYELKGAQQIRDLMRTLRLFFEHNPGTGARITALIDHENSPGMSPETRSLLQALTKLYDGPPNRYINFYGPPGTITTIPYHAVIKGGDPNLNKGAMDFTNKTVFVGFSDLFDPGQPDRFYTVFTRSDGVDVSGVEIAATAYANLLTDRTLKPSGAPATSIVLVLFGIVMGTIVYCLRAVASVLLSLTLAVAYAIAAQWMFNTHDYWLPLAVPLLMQFPSALFTGLLGQYLLERRRLEKITQAIGYYLPENVARRLTEGGRDEENKLRRALEEEQFVLHYQPKVDLRSGRITGLEALIRWQSPERGLVPPGTFIPVLEETGLIVDVGRWVTEQAAADYSELLVKGLHPPRIAVNVSPLQLRQKGFVDELKRAIEKGDRGGDLELEVTESLIMEDVEGTTEKLKMVREMGVSVTVDDFGTGFSSLSYLVTLPIDCLKIDRAFIDNMINSAENLAIVSAVISLAHSLNLKVVAEGVETEEQANLLRLLECDEMQGYFFSRPVPLQQIETMLRDATSQ
jgi:EAL domain-containing protein (putative c-di-GMP-specific phosphodiesterase class I)/CHASE2 domain-containing sensor protein